MNSFETIVAQISALCMFDQVTLIADCLETTNPNLCALTDEHIQTLMWLNTVLHEDNRAPMIIAKATLIGHNTIKKAISEISILLRIENEKTYSHIRENPKLLLISSMHANKVYSYLQDIGLSSHQIKDIFFEAALLDEKTLKKRCETVLKHWTVNDLVRLVKQNIFSDLPYCDPIEAINVTVNTLGVEKAMEFFNSHPSFFTIYRAKECRQLPSDIMSYENALTALKSFKNTI